MTDSVFNPDKIEVAAHRTVRCRRTGRYFTGQGWTENRSQARRFANEIDAAVACVENDLTQVDLVVSLPGNGQEIFSTEIR